MVSILLKVFPAAVDMEDCNCFVWLSPDPLVCSSSGYGAMDIPLTSQLMQDLLMNNLLRYIAAQAADTSIPS